MLTQHFEGFSVACYEAFGGGFVAILHRIEGQPLSGKGCTEEKAIEKVLKIKHIDDKRNILKGN